MESDESPAHFLERLPARTATAVLGLLTGKDQRFTVGHVDPVAEALDLTPMYLLGLDRRFRTPAELVRAAATDPELADEYRPYLAQVARRESE